MSHDLIYISGPPGAGKSTLMAALTQGYMRELVTTPFAHDLLYAPSPIADVPQPTLAVELGRRRATFSGTDALGMAVAPTARAWIAQQPAQLILGEGDRLANRGFLNAAQDAGYAVHLVHLFADPDTLNIRCTVRGSKQNASWRAGRATKARNLADAAGPEGWDLIRLGNTGRSATHYARALRRRLPALAALPEITAA